MKKRTWGIGWTAAAAVACALLLSGATFGHARSSAAQAVSCGAVVTTSVTLTSDLDCPLSGAISAGANNIVINLNGHLLQGNDNGNGVGVSGFSGVTIENGTVETFNFGVGATNAPNLHIIGMRIISNSTDGIAVGLSTGLVISGNLVESNTSQNISASDDTATITGNRSVNAGAAGIMVASVTTATVTSNVTNNNGTQGIDITGMAAGSVTSNISDGNGSDGIDVTASGNQPKPVVSVAHNRASFNTALGFNVDFVVDGGGNVVQANGNAKQCIYLSCDAVSS